MIIPTVVLMAQVVIVFASGTITDSAVIPAVISGAFLTVNSLLTFWLTTRIENRGQAERRPTKKKNRQDSDGSGDGKHSPRRRRFPN